MKTYRLKPLLDFAESKGIDITQRVVSIFSLPVPDTRDNLEILFLLSYNPTTNEVDRFEIPHSYYDILTGRNTNKRIMDEIDYKDGVFYARRGDGPCMGYITFPISAIKYIDKHNNRYPGRVGANVHMTYISSKAVTLGLEGYLDMIRIELCEYRNLHHYLPSQETLVCDVTYMIPSWLNLSNQNRSFLQLSDPKSYKLMDDMINNSHLGENLKYLDIFDNLTEEDSILHKLRKKGL